MGVDLFIKDAGLLEWERVLAVAVLIVTLLASFYKFYRLAVKQFGEFCIRRTYNYWKDRKRRGMETVAKQMMPYIFKGLDDEMTTFINNITDQLENNELTLKHSIRENTNFQDMAKTAIANSKQRLDAMLKMASENTAELEIFNAKLSELEKTQKTVLTTLDKRQKDRRS